MDEQLNDMKEPIRVIKLSQTEAERIKTDIQLGGDEELIGNVIAVMMSRLALIKGRAWEEVARIAELNRETEAMTISFVRNEIIVRKKTLSEMQDDE